MAISNLRLNVTANTARALADFNKFSRSLDNKFLVSGLKLDIVRNALGQINRDFQRAIGEQGLASASSLRAAQNQAALLTQTFKGFASESALSITQNIGTALNNVAVRAGGTMKDVQKTLAATPFIDINLSEDLRNKLAKGILSFQRDMRRAGLGENFGGLAQQFLMGQATGMQMLNSGDAMQSFLGSQIIKRVGGEGMLYSPEERTRVLSDILNDPEIIKQLSEMAKRAAGFRIILEDLNTKLFNTESGVFGSLRKVIDRTGKSTTMFDEVYKLVDQVFGSNGMFRAIFSSIQEIFGIGDPMRPFIDAIQFVTRIFNDLTAYFESSGFKDILVMVRETFGRVGELFKGVYDQIRGGTFDSEDITRVISEIGSSVREYIVNISKAIRGEDITQESGFVSDIAGSLFEEVGKTAVVLIKELFSILLDKVPEIASQVLPAINRGINSILTEAFGEVGAKIVKFILGFVPGPVGMVARASAVGDVTGGGGNILSMLAMGAGALAGPAALFGAARLGRGLFGGDQARMGLLSSLTQRTNRVEELYNSRMRQLYMPGAQRVPLSGFLSRFLSPRSSFASVNPNFFESLPNPNYYPSSPLPTSGIRRPSTRMAPPFINPMGMIIGPETSMFEAIPGFFEQEKTRRESAIRGNRGRSVREGMERYRRSLSSYRPETSAFKYYNVPEYLTRDPIDYTGFDRPIGPQRHGDNWAYAPEYGGIGGDYAPFMESSYTSPREREIRRRLSASERYKRMHESGSLGRMSRRSSMRSIASRFRPGKRMALGLGAAGIVSAMTLLGGPGAKAQTTQFDPATGQMVPVAGGGGGGIDFSGVGSVLSGGFEGATLGATIGSVVPGIGTAAGAVIGGIIGGVAPLLDKGVRDGIGKFLESINTGFQNTISWFLEGTKKNFEVVGDMLKTGFKFFVNGIISVLNFTLNGFQIIPRLISNMVEAAYNRLPGANLIPGLKEAVQVTKSISNFQMPLFAEGKDYIGGTMALEARLSGNRPMVVNDGEFVIPRDGFPILAGLVGENLRTTGVINNGGNQPIQINVSLSVTANSVVADANELATVLREPVYKIVGDAWDEAVNATRVHRARVN